MGEPKLGHLKKTCTYEPPYQGIKNRCKNKGKGALRNGHCHSCEKVDKNDD